jgi:hypothetical protein
MRVKVMKAKSKKKPIQQRYLEDRVRELEDIQLKVLGQIYTLSEATENLLSLSGHMDSIKELAQGLVPLQKQLEKLREAQEHSSVMYG